MSGSWCRCVGGMGDGDARAGEGAGVGVVKGFAERREFQGAGSGGSGGRRGGAP